MPQYKQNVFTHCNLKWTCKMLKKIHHREKLNNLKSSIVWNEMLNIKKVIFNVSLTHLTRVVGMYLAHNGENKIKYRI